jgi:hypothetical protein
MNTTRPLAIALLLISAAGAASADDNSSHAAIQNTDQGSSAKLHSFGYHGTVQPLNRFQPYGDSTGGTSEAAGHLLDTAPAAAVASTHADSLDAVDMSRLSQERAVR